MRRPATLSNLALLAAFVANAVACAAPLAEPDDPEVVEVEAALSGTVTLLASGATSRGYDFSAGVYTDVAGGDFYFSKPGGTAQFFANNDGQHGVVSAGTCSSVDAVTTMPTTGYSRYGVTAVTGRCYVALTHWDERDHVVFRVTSLTSTQAVLSWKLVVSGNAGAVLTTGSNSSSGYDFSARTYKGASGGDFYFNAGSFWANNLGQRGVVRLGPCSTLASITQPPPETGYWRAGTTATAGDCYVSLTQNEERETILFRVDEINSVTVTLTWKLVDYCFGYPDPRGSVACWLMRNSSIAQYLVWENRNSYGVAAPIAWSSWPNVKRDELRASVRSYQPVLDDAMAADPDPLTDPPMNLETLADTAFPMAVLGSGDAWRLYLKTVAMSLAVELKQFVPWSVTSSAYGPRGLETLFDSRHMLAYTWSGSPAQWGGPKPLAEGYLVIDNAYAQADNNAFTPGLGFAVPAAPYKTLKLLRDRALIGMTRLQTITNVIDWSRRLRHFSYSLDTYNFYDHWQYRGPAPVARTIDATTRPGTSAPRHYTAGCHGTALLLQSVLRTVNIPVGIKRVHGSTVHSMPRFTTEDLYMSHGDDPYDSDIYGVPPSALLISAASYTAWFTGNLSQARISQNVGRADPDAMIKYLSGTLQRLYCDDVEQGRSHANSLILSHTDFATRPLLYPLSYLEALPPEPGLPASLWDRLRDKVAAQNGCAATIAALDQQKQACLAVTPSAEQLHCLGPGAF